MGKPMAKNILKQGFSLVVYNRTRSKTKELERLGARVASSPQTMAATVDLVITMVTGPKDVDEVIFGKQGVIKGAKSGLVVVDMSTIGPKAAKKIGNRLEESGISFLDAPVTGSTPKAITGELTIFVGGKSKVLKKALPVLRAMGTVIHHMGPIGSGQAVKLVNNLLVAQTLTTLAEGFLLGDKLGLSRRKVAQTLQNVPAVSPFMKLRMANFVKNQHQTLFSLANMDKDLNLAAQELSMTNSKLPILNQVKKLFDKGTRDKKLKDRDISAIIHVLNS